jgi:hypothetical protein
MVVHITNKARQNIYYKPVLDFIIKKQSGISQEVHGSKHPLYHFAIIWLLALHDHIYRIRKAWETEAA